MSNKQTPESFWARVKRGTAEECWPWTGCLVKNGMGYGLVGWHGTQYVTHRVAYWLTFGGIALAAPKDKDVKEYVLHSCDNPLCCNPAHLFLGNKTDNMIDMTIKGRHIIFRGHTHPYAKLSETDVINIRAEYALGETRAALGRKYRVTAPNIGHVVNFRTHKG